MRENSSLEEPICKSELVIRSKHIGGAVDRMLTQPAIIILGEFLIRQIIGLQCQIEALQLASLQFITDLGVNNRLAANALIVWITIIIYDFPEKLRAAAIADA